MRIRHALAPAGLAPLLVLGTAAPAAASNVSCTGIAPVQNSCSRSGVVGSSFTMGFDPLGPYTGTVTLTASTTTWVRSMYVTYELGTVVDQFSTGSGTLFFGQAYTFDVSLDGLGARWEAYVISP